MNRSIKKSCFMKSYCVIIQPDSVKKIKIKIKFSSGIEKYKLSPYMNFVHMYKNWEVLE